MYIIEVQSEKDLVFVGSNGPQRTMEDCRPFLEPEQAMAKLEGLKKLHAMTVSGEMPAPRGIKLAAKRIGPVEFKLVQVHL